MATQLIDQTGRTVQLGREIGRGGEGTVFEVVGRPDLVAKVYKQAADQLKAQKLLFMAAKASPELMRLAAWPSAVLFDQSNIPRGITMPLVTGAREIHVLYSPAQRRTHFPKADWHFLIRAARNCAASFAILHQSDVVVGDVNQGNILVDKDALVRLIDCDSFQLTAQGRVFRCMVGVSHFTPPELQSCSFDRVDRTQNHDSFGLAVVLFHLLFMGRHPFAGKFMGRGEMPTIEDSISHNRFAFGVNASRFQLAPPPGSPTLSIIPSELAILFERSFALGSERPGARPRATEWVPALDRLEANLAKCAADPGHIYARATGSCPWCTLDSTSGTHFFISVTLDRLTTATTCDVDAIWNAILAIPSPADVLIGLNSPPVPPIVPRARPRNIDDKQTFINAIGITAASGLALGLVAILAGVTALGITMLVLSLAMAGTWLYLYRESPLGKERAARGAIVREAEYEWRNAAGALSAQLQHYSDNFDRRFARLNGPRQQLAQLEQQKSNRLAEMQREAQTRQFNDYMDGFNIADADVPGIGSTRAAILAYHGIETARDIPDASAIMAIQGFGEVLASSLVAWRQYIANQFQFSASRGLPLADIQALTLQFQQQRLKLEAELRQGEPDLRRISGAARNELEPLHRHAAILKHAVDQARADLRVL